MTRNIEKIIEESIESVIIDYIVEQVIKKIEDKNKKALVVFTGATIGHQKSIEGIKKLKEDGWKLDVVLSKAASKVLKEDLIKKSLGIDKIIADNDDADVHKLVEDNTLVIVPTLTVNTCSKVVNCISDNTATNVISYSMMIGKKVVASIDGCCPDNEERISLGKGKVTEAHKNVLRNNLATLKSYGVVLTKSENIDYKVNKIFKDKYSLSNNTSSNESKNSSKKGSNLKENNLSKYNHNLESEVFLDKKIISRIDIFQNSNYKNIKVNKNAIITDLAREEAVRLKINLLKV